jgi:glutamate-ammonia-ligase adenylyltransferase
LAKRAAKKTAAKRRPAAGAAATPASTAPRDKVQAWLAEIRHTVPGAAIAALLARTPARRALIESIAAASPYLWELATKDPARLLAALEADPEARLREILDEGAAAVAAASDEPHAMRLLRRMKAQAALLIALADIAGAWPVMRVTRALTELADTALTAALRHLLRAAAQAG